MGDYWDAFVRAVQLMYFNYYDALGPILSKGFHLKKEPSPRKEKEEDK